MSLPTLDTAPTTIAYRAFFHLFRNPLVAFIFQILLAIHSAVLVLTQKFSTPDDPKKECGLNASEGNTWAFGQMLAMAMLLIPVLSAVQTYLGQ